MTSVYDFLNKLNRFFPSNEKEETLKERVNEYSNSILLKAQNNHCQYDYDKVFSYLIQNYKYKTFPSLPDILDALPYGVVKRESYSGREGDVIKKTINGIEYEFTVVPNHWTNVKTISELDEEIERRKQREIA